MFTSPPPVAQINHVLDANQLPHIRRARCAGDTCLGLVDGHRTTWRVTLRSGAQLVCLCYLTKPPRPIPRP